ncbi:hypothetical protein [Phyllobacterium brassicacearum]|uniref:hypothetical protein n=1 Tax=Phyllobacterium brassicacearum TaxID=314235 RepID=UPI0010D14CCB|nr:hypothetical protein [Phyllobacterium brassicacearum]TDQ30535.1 hypothetical protein DEV91_108156 [Phyllobacterium brassicacearum]
MAIKFALKDQKSVAADENRAKADVKTVAAPVANVDTVTDTGSDLFDAKPVGSKRKRKK